MEGLYKIARKLVRTDFVEPWDFRLLIGGGELDLFIKDMSFGPVEIETEAIKAGAVTLTYPEGTSPTAISLTVRDHLDRRIYKWFTEWKKKVVNSDGTFNLPMGKNGYLRKAELYSLTAKYEEDPLDSWWVFPQKMGDITQSVDAQGFLEFPLTFIQFNSQR